MIMMIAMRLIVATSLFLRMANADLFAFEPIRNPEPGSIGMCDSTKDCDKDIDCADGLVCADERKMLLMFLGYDPRGANCTNLEEKPWNWEVCFDPAILGGYMNETAPPSAGGGGDPHFRTYDGTRYSFHGQCDLVMARSTEFADGQGIDIHARTHIVDDWSLISNVAIRIGDDIIEIVNDATYYINGMANVDLPFSIADKYTVSRSVESLESITDDGEKVLDTMDVFTIKLSINNNNNERIKIQNYKRMISVRVDVALYGTSGMLGVHGKVGMIGRDMVNQIEDSNVMGSEWQVRDNEPMLFQDTTHVPQYPERCIMPTTLTSRRRRLRTLESEMRQAREACVDVNDESFDFCVQDVLQTGDVNVAKAYNYGFAF